MTTSIRLLASDEETPVFLRVMESLTRELFTFGQLNHAAGFIKTNAAAYLERAAFIYTLTEVLEPVIGLRFTEDAKVPFHWVNPDWPAGPQNLSLGYCNEPGAPLPHHVIRAYMAEWSASEEKRQRRTDNWTPRPAKAVAIRWKEQGTPAAVQYLFDLWVEGAVPSVTSAVTAFDVLTQLVVNDDLEGKIQLVPDEFDSYTDATELTRAWSLIPLGRHPKADAAQIRTDIILSGVANEINELRDSGSLSEWILRYARVHRAERLLRYANDHYPARSLMARTMAAQYEEIGCDAAVVIGAISNNVKIGALEGTGVLSILERVIEIAASSSPSVTNQRAGRPRALGDLNDTTRRERHWMGLSLQSVNAFYGAFPELGTPEHSPASSLGDVDPVAEWKRTVLAAAEANNHDARRAQEIALEGLAKFPFSWHIRWEHAIALDTLDRSDEALEVLLDALSLAPKEDGLWASLSVVLGRLGLFDQSLLASNLAAAIEATADRFERPTTDPG